MQDLILMVHVQKEQKITYMYKQTCSNKNEITKKKPIDKYKYWAKKSYISQTDIIYVTFYFILHNILSGGLFLI
jgi:hypothetical protein